MNRNPLLSLKSFALSSIVAILVLSFGGCATSPALQASKPVTAQGRSAVLAWRERIHARFSGLQDVADFSGAKVPVISSPKLEREWGKPRVRVAGDGSVQLIYNQTGHLFGLVCMSLVSPLASPEAAPDWIEESDDPMGTVDRTVLHPQSWRKAVIAGVPVQWCQMDGGGGADYPTYSTQCFTATARDGRTGHYIVQAWATSDAKAAELLRKAELPR